jgi:hypothetical protein
MTAIRTGALGRNRDTAWPNPLQALIRADEPGHDARWT